MEEKAIQIENKRENRSKGNGMGTRPERNDTTKRSSKKKEKAQQHEAIKRTTRQGTDHVRQQRGPGSLVADASDNTLETLGSACSHERNIDELGHEERKEAKTMTKNKQQQERKQHHYQHCQQHQGESPPVSGSLQNPPA